MLNLAAVCRMGEETKVDVRKPVNMISDTK